MRTQIAILVVAGAALAAAACGQPASRYSGPTDFTPVAAAPAPTVASVAAQPASPGGGGAPGGTNPAARVSGTVQSIDGTRITLTDGTSFALAADARVTQQRTVTAADLRSGQFVAVTAKRQPDNTLLATIVSVFPASLSTAVPGGQRPLPEGNLMTNASIDQVDGNSFTVTFTGGGAKVVLAPDAKLLQQTDATVGDLRPGATISATVSDGTARSVVIG
jgi:uncharacterized protein DUF5666